MSMSIKMGNTPLNQPFAGGMLKSVQDRMQRQQERDNKIAFYENQIASLKDMQADSLEDISRKLDMFHTYQDSIAAAKEEYNNSQQFKVLDEARERGEKAHKEVEKMEPKTAEERRKEMAEEALRTDEKGKLTETLDELTEMVEEMAEENLDEMAEMTEELTGDTEELLRVSSEGMLPEGKIDEEKMLARRSVDYYI